MRKMAAMVRGQASRFIRPKWFRCAQEEMARNSSAGEKGFKTGLWGAIIAAICCSTPALVIVLGFLGLSAVIPYLDYILIPLLVIFLILAL
jgi:mercuric ion transport protein